MHLLPILLRTNILFPVIFVVFHLIAAVLFWMFIAIRQINLLTWWKNNKQARRIVIGYAAVALIFIYLTAFSRMF